jgi:uncharacterized protein
MDVAALTVVIAKSPVPGKVKTRLVPPLTYEQAADFAAAALLDTMAVVEAAGTNVAVALDGDVADLPPRPNGWDNVDIRSQGSGTLGERLAYVFGQAFVRSPVPASVVIIAMDSPQVGVLDLRGAHEALTSSDVVVGPSADGGYWLIGFSHGAASLAATAFDTVPMSTDHTYEAQVHRLRSLGASLATLRVLRDVDTFDDALAVAAEIHGSHTARTVSSWTLHR